MFKTFLNLGLAALLSALILTACNKSQKTEESSAAQAANVQKISLDVEGMTCSGCEFNVESAIKKVPGVANVEFTARC